MYQSDKFNFPLPASDKLKVNHMVSTTKASDLQWIEMRNIGDFNPIKPRGGGHNQQYAHQGLKNIMCQ